jgi:hypothetical protein
VGCWLFSSCCRANISQQSYNLIHAPIPDDIRRELLLIIIILLWWWPCHELCETSKLGSSVVEMMPNQRMKNGIDFPLRSSLPRRATVLRSAASLRLRWGSAGSALMTHCAVYAYSKTLLYERTSFIVPLLFFSYRCFSLSVHRSPSFFSSLSVVQK